MMLLSFHELCEWLGVTLAKEKTVWGTTQLVFLGILLDGQRYFLGLPTDKIDKASLLLKTLLSKKKGMVKQIQMLAGLFNFLHRAIYPGRAFTRRMYAKIPVDSAGSKVVGLKSHHDISLDAEFRQDCLTWLSFLEGSRQSSRFCRPFADLDMVVVAEELGFQTDSSASEVLGFGGVCGKQYFWGQWEENYIKKLKPSIAYLELYAVCTGIYIWSNKFSNRRLLLHCDNISVVQMVNQTSSSCKCCMHLIRKLVLRGLEYNFRVFTVYIPTKLNCLADSLSRLQFKRFEQLTRWEKT